MHRYFITVALTVSVLAASLLATSFSNPDVYDLNDLSDCGYEESYDDPVIVLEPIEPIMVTDDGLCVHETQLTPSFDALYILGNPDSRPTYVVERLSGTWHCIDHPGAKDK